MKSCAATRVGCLKFLALAGLLVNGIAFADYQSGVAAYQRGQFDVALEEWSRVLNSPPDVVHPAELAETLYAVAMLFWIGQGVEQDTARSAELLQQAAELNHPGAQSKLGYLYLIGQGVPQSHSEAGKWLEMAAQQGDPDAQYNLGVIYRDGLGTEVDTGKSLRWFREAAANGDAYSAQVVAAFEREGALQQNAGAGQESAPQQVADVQAAPEDAAVLDTKPAGQSTAEPTAEPATEPALEPAIQPATEPTAQLSAEPTPEFTAVPAVEPAKESVGAVQGEEWILSRNPDHYTIQVIALKNRDNLIKLTDAHAQLQPMAVYRQGTEASPLYVLVQGDYADLEGARAAVSAFPRSLVQPRQLWIRRYAMVQSLIDTHSGDARAE